jgi:hypothetical protein
VKRFFVAAFVACLVSIQAGSALAGPNGTNRPFSATGSGTTAIVSNPSPGVFGSSSAGTLNATHLGKSTYTISATQTWGPDLGDVCAGSAIVAAVSGTTTFSAANGVKVYGSVSGRTCELAPFNDTTYGSLLNVTITGRTGRFAGATGTLTTTGTSAGPAGGPFADSFSTTGTISY